MQSLRSIIGRECDFTPNEIRKMKEAATEIVAFMQKNGLTHGQAVEVLTLCKTKLDLCKIGTAHEESEPELRPNYISNYQEP